MKFLQSFFLFLAAMFGLVLHFIKGFGRALFQPSPPGESSLFVIRKGLAFVLLCIGVLVITLNVSLYAQIQRYKAYHEAAWVDQYGTNVFKLSRDAAPQALLGTNLYTGLTLTTNMSLTNVYMLSVKRGLIVGVTSP